MRSMAWPDAVANRAIGVMNATLSGSASTAAWAAGRAKRRSSGAAPASSTVRKPQTAWCSSHSRA